MTIYHWQVCHKRAEDLLAELPDNSVDLILTDPPYYKVKHESWDRQWDNPTAFLHWMGQLCEGWKRVLKPNGSLYVFASPKMAARVEVKIGETFNILQRITWRKPPYSTKAEMFDKETMRNFFPASEAIIFAEHYGADNMAKGEAGYEAKCDELRGFVFEPVREYLEAERQAAGINFDQVRDIVGCRPGSGLPSHWFTRSQWMLPTSQNYAKLQAATGYFARDYGALRQQYEVLRQQYEVLRQQYEALRRYFAVSADVPYTDVWDFPTVQSYSGKHPCEKPQALLRHIIQASSREGATVLDTFCGGGSTGEAALALGRNVILCDALEHWVNYARKRLETVASLPTQTCLSI